MAVGVDTHCEVEQEEILEHDDLTLHALDLTDVRHPAAAVAQPGELDDDVDGRGHLLANGPHRQIHAGHQDHGLDPGETVPGRVGVHRRQRTVVPGVHSLEHVEGLAAAAFPDDDAVGAHPERV